MCCWPMRYSRFAYVIGESRMVWIGTSWNNTRTPRSSQGRFPGNLFVVGLVIDRKNSTFLGNQRPDLGALYISTLQLIHRQPMSSMRRKWWHYYVWFQATKYGLFHRSFTAICVFTLFSSCILGHELSNFLVPDCWYPLAEELKGSDTFHL